MSESSRDHIKQEVVEGVNGFFDHMKAYGKLGEDLREGVGMIMQGFAKVQACHNTMSTVKVDLYTDFRRFDTALEGTDALRDPLDKLYAFIGALYEQADVIENLTEVGKMVERHPIHQVPEQVGEAAPALDMPLQQVRTRGLFM